LPAVHFDNLSINMSLWPFKKKRPLPFADDLNPAEIQMLDENRQSFKRLANAQLSNSADPLQVCDDLLRCWHQLPVAERPDANLLVNAIGVTLGDKLASELALEWKIVTDTFGTDLALWRADQGRHIILSPTHSVAKRFAEGKDGFVAALYPALLTSAGQV
jgi:hypothetical protein